VSRKRSMNRKTLLYILLGIFAITLTYRILNPYRQERVSDGAAQRSPAASTVQNPSAKGGTPTQGVTAVTVDRFLNPPKHSGETARDLFSEKQEVVPAPRKEEVQAAPVETSFSPPEDPREQVSRDLGNIRVFGAYSRGGEKGLFLERGKEILIIHEGDRIDGKYLVKEITEKSVTLRAEFINEDVRIDLSDF
jgi:hypothetical protein